MSTTTDEQLAEECWKNFFLVATLQGRLAYLLMSIHAVNPSICASFTDRDPTHVLFANMIYGGAAHLFSRPIMSLVGFIHRTSFSILGSMMFNYSSMQVFEWLSVKFENRPYLLTFFGFFFGRLMIVHWHAFLYHIDTRSILGPTLRRDAVYESIYD